jgi:predicted Zn-dependent protease
VAIHVHTSNSRVAEGFTDLLFDRVDQGTVEALEDADSPLNPDGLRETTLAIALLETGRAAEGERVAIGATREEPESVNAWVTLARIQRTIGKLDEARRSYARARELNSQIPPRDLPPPF